MLSNTYTMSVSASATGRWRKNIMRITPRTPAAVRMINSAVLDLAVMMVSPANRKYTIRLPNNKLIKPKTRL